MLEKETVYKNLALTREKISAVTKREITIVAVTKTLPASVYEICYELGLNHIGENKIQELKTKTEEKQHLRDKLIFHAIGHLQSNKVKYLHQIANCLDTLASVEILKIIENLKEKNNLKPLPVLIQINSSHEPQKSGIHIDNLDEAYKLAELCENNTAVKLEGIFTIGPDPSVLSENKFELETRKSFSKTREIKEQIEKQIKRNLPRLSMGMSSDYLWAIEEGATEIRIGSTLFGARH
ncbi:MAG: YggS family pyridoxal phosphate-dependent enzyme [Spirochaetia bacterium]|nr:YggS family pyridoxal phosphate-dependent enzyme [Spirochaetia bacterium]